ncbi:caveolin-2-like isoform X1 [Hyla sarda]|uniref:caveolin-2-like isoform X1 n=1 Tax=Hyla sarda TaxID=327740 RepID=UPI0024C3E452|nr:caveolin-2-like isoform X1 [Hyla sarda]
MLFYQVPRPSLPILGSGSGTSIPRMSGCDGRIHDTSHAFRCDVDQVDFSDVLAEPNSFHSFDKVWTWSDILFESSKLWCYRIISLLCAVPVSLISGILFALLGCLHIWCAMPCIQLCNICMPPIRTLWASILDVCVAPLCTSLGRCFSSIYVNVAKQRV